jgi:uncharacterized protein YbgA (DUF1722 family)/uncharacterized protein YbbK (DUF523 family)
MINSEFVQEARSHLDFIPACPEMEIGLGVPRDSIRIVDVRGMKRLIQPKTGLDVTERMNRFAFRFLSSLNAVDGFILKFRSPSCALKDVRVYAGEKSNVIAGKSPGLFGGAVLSAYPGLAIEDEGRLRNHDIRDHFLTKLFALAGFRRIEEMKDMHALISFHEKNKLLLMAYNQSELKIMGRLVANHARIDINELTARYRKHLSSALLAPGGVGRNIDVLMHAAGHFKDELSPPEKQLLNSSLQAYRSGQIPQSAAIAVLLGMASRFENEYLLSQSYFHPYPDELRRICGR